MATYSALQTKKRELIRKAPRGSVFVAPGTADLITNLTTYAAGPPVVIDLTPLPAGYADAGWTTQDGAQFARDVATSEINSWGSDSPTRSDITGDTTTMTVTMQETNLTTIGVGTGVDAAAIEAAFESGELSIEQPLVSTSRSYRVLALAVDTNAATGGEIYIARYLPAGKVTGFTGQNLAGGDNVIEWGVTFTGEPDSVAGYANRWIFGGPGWNDLLTEMNIPQAVA